MGRRGGGVGKTGRKEKQVRINIEKADIPYSRCGRTKAPYKGMKVDFERSWKERLIMKINRLALFASSVH